MHAAVASPSRAEHDPNSMACLASPTVAAMTPAYGDFIGLFREQAENLLVFFERRVAEPELATDLVAETFTRAIGEREQYGRLPEEDLTGWLWRIARETLVSYQDRVAREGAHALAPGSPQRRQLSDSEVREIERLADIGQLRREALRQLIRLPPALRDAVRLRIVHELSYEQVAERLEIAPEQARVRVWQGLAQIVEQLSDEEAQP